MQHVREGDLYAPCRTRTTSSFEVRAPHMTWRPAGHRILASSRGVDIRISHIRCGRATDPSRAITRQLISFTEFPRCRRCIWHRGRLVSLLPRQLLYGTCLSNCVVFSQAQDTRLQGPCKSGCWKPCLNWRLQCQTLYLSLVSMCLGIMLCHWVCIGGSHVEENC